MSSALAPRPNDRPPEGEEWGTGVTISVVAHLALVGALVWGLHWRNRTEVVTASAELWAAVPEAVAPPPVEAPPPPPAPPAPAPAPVEAPKPPPDIVIEKTPEKKPEKPLPPPPKPPAKVEAAKPTPAPPPKERLDAKTLQKMRDENLKRMMGQMDAPVDATGNAAHNAAPSANYLGRIVAQLKRNMVLADSVPGNAPVEVEINCAPDGTIIGRRITKHSGSQVWDDAVLRAIDRTGTLPRDTDGKALASIPISWRPQD